jgi:hypothetical protein
MSSLISLNLLPTIYSIDRALIFMDRKLDYLPLVSTVTNSFTLTLKVFLKIKGVEVQSEYLSHVKKKSLKRCVVALIPGIGNSTLLALRACQRTSKETFNKKDFLKKILPEIQSSNPKNELIARKRVAKCVIDEDSYLELNQLNLIALPEELFKLRHLRHLGIANNAIKRLPSMPHITHLVVDIYIDRLRLSESCKVEYSLKKRDFTSRRLKLHSLQVLQEPLRCNPTNSFFAQKLSED